VHPTQIAHWKHRLHKELPDIFSVRRDKRERDQEAFQAQLYQHIGQRKVEVDWLKKKLDLPPESKRELIEPAHPQISTDFSDLCVRLVFMRLSRPPPVKVL
jgi:putative transposase